MKIHLNQIGSVILIIWIIQFGVYFVQIFFPKLIYFGMRKTLLISITTCIIIAIILMVGSFYERNPNSTCGTEEFNPLAIIGIGGSLGSIFIFLFVSIINKLVNNIRKAFG